MTPTNKLRFVERIETFITQPYGVSTGRKISVLQQWWEDSDPELVSELNGSKTYKVDGEWRDVPLETEE